MQYCDVLYPETAKEPAAEKSGDDGDETGPASKKPAAGSGGGVSDELAAEIAALKAEAATGGAASGRKKRFWVSDPVMIARGDLVKTFTPPVAIFAGLSRPVFREGHDAGD